MSFPPSPLPLRVESKPLHSSHVEDTSSISSVCIRSGFHVGHARRLGAYGVQELHAKDLGDGEVLTEEPRRALRALEEPKRPSDLGGRTPRRQVLGPRGAQPLALPEVLDDVDGEVPDGTGGHHEGQTTARILVEEAARQSSKLLLQRFSPCFGTTSAPRHGRRASRELDLSPRPPRWGV